MDRCPMHLLTTCHAFVSVFYTTQPGNTISDYVRIYIGLTASLYLCTCVSLCLFLCLFLCFLVAQGEPGPPGVAGRKGTNGAPVSG